MSDKRSSEYMGVYSIHAIIASVVIRIIFGLERRKRILMIALKKEDFPSQRQ